MKQMGFLSVMLSVFLFSTVAWSANTSGGNGQQASDCCARGRQVAPTASEAKTPEGFASCKYCGMDREKFAHSRMLIEYDDGSSLGTCSIHCLAVELANSIDRTHTAIKVGDYGTKKLIDAETAFWVVGGDKAGVMSSRAKWAFEKKADAEAFIAANSGTLGSFDDAIRSAYEDMFKDTKMIRDRRKMKRMQQMEPK
jgi:copper chaperone NosL